MKICVAGKNNIASNVLEYIYNNIQSDDLFVVCNRDDSGKHSWQKSLRRTASLLGIKEVLLQEVYEIKDLLFLSVEFDKIIKPSLFSTDDLINIHFSLLPKYKGVYTAAWPLLNGEKFTGATLHKIDSGIDTGDIIDQKMYLINEYTARDIYIENMKVGYELIVENIQKLVDKKYKSVKQNYLESTYYSLKSIDYSGLKINYNCTAYQIQKQVRAFSFFEYQMPMFENYHINDVLILDCKSLGRPGTVLVDNNRHIEISTVDYNVRLIKDFRYHLFDEITNNNLLAVIENIGCIDDVNVTNKNGWSMLMVAVYNNCINICKVLIKAGADVNQVNLNGTSVLMYAKDGGLPTNDIAILQLLIDAGADVNWRDFSGKNVLDYCIENGNHEMAEFFKKFTK